MDNLKRGNGETHGNEAQKAGSDFITERIKKRPVNKIKLLRKTLITAAMAVIFALVACLTFLILEPVISNWLYPKEEPAPIEFPAETEEMLPEDMIADDSQMEEPAPPVEVKLEDEQIARVLDSIELDFDDYLSMYGSMAKVAEEAGKSLVTVTGSVSNVDWFNDTYEKKNQASGIVVAKTEREVLILVNYEKVINAENIVVTFYRGSQAQAQMKKKDANTKLAILSVQLEELGEDAADWVTAADLTASSHSRMLVGNPVIAIGSPLGNGDSVCYGVLTSNNNLLNTVDSYYKILTTDIYGSQNASGVLINVRGQVLGIIDNSHNSEDMKNLVSALGITELRRVIERMSNERDQAYLGIHGMDVTADANENMGVPFGTYITEIEMDSPAMTAGIQSGDVVTEINGKPIGVYSDFVNVMADLEPESIVTVMLMRQGPEGYVQMEVEVTLGVLE